MNLGFESYAVIERGLSYMILRVLTLSSMSNGCLSEFSFPQPSFYPQCARQFSHLATRAIVKLYIPFVVVVSEGDVGNR